MRNLLPHLLCVSIVVCPCSTFAQQADPLEQARDAFRSALERVMIPKDRLTDGPQVRAAFRTAVSESTAATVEVRSGGKRVALGGVVGADGWVLTKATQLNEPVTCRLQDGRELDARIVGIDKAFDLAMLKLDAKGLPVLTLLREDDAEVGEWVATVSTGRDPMAVGVVSVATRPIRQQRGWLGIQLDMNTTDPRVTLVYEDSGAAAAGVQVNDLVTAVNEIPTPTRERLINTIKDYSPGDAIELEIRRNGKKLSLHGVLTARVAGMPMDRRDFQNSLGSQLSERRFGFPGAFQHDTVLKPRDCGGPLVDLDGRVVGFNIARSGRTESYAIPASAIVPRLYDLMSGNLAPVAEEQQDDTTLQETAEEDPATEGEETEAAPPSDS